MALGRRMLEDVVLATVVGLAVGLAIYLTLQLTRQRTPIEAAVIVAHGAAPDIAALINSEVFQGQVVQGLTASEHVHLNEVSRELAFLRAAAKRPDLIEIRTMAREEATGKKLVDAVAQQVLSHPLRFRLADLGRRYGVYSAVRDHSAECERQFPFDSDHVPGPVLAEVKLQSLFLAATLLRELELQGRADNFLEHFKAIATVGVERLSGGPAPRTYSEFQSLYQHALCESTHALASAQLAITGKLVSTEYRLLYAASAQRQPPERSLAKILMLAVPAGLIAAWLMLIWRRRARGHA